MALSFFIFLFLTGSYINALSMDVDTLIKDIFEQDGTENKKPISTNSDSGNLKCTCVPYYMCDSSTMNTKDDTIEDIR